MPNNNQPTGAAPSGGQQWQYIQLPDGQYGQFPASATDDQIRSVVEKNYPETATYHPSAQEQAANPVATAMAQEGLTDLNEAQARAAFAGQHPYLYAAGSTLSEGLPGVMEAPWSALPAAARGLAGRGAAAAGGMWAGGKVGGGIGREAQELTGIPGLGTVGTVLGSALGGLGAGLGLSKVGIPESIDIRGFKIPVPGWIRSAGAPATTDPAAAQAAALGKIQTPSTSQASALGTIQTPQESVITPRQITPEPAATSPAPPTTTTPPTAKPRLKIPGVAERQTTNPLGTLQTSPQTTTTAAPQSLSNLIDKFQRGEPLTLEEQLTLSNQVAAQPGGREAMGRYMAGQKYMGGAKTK